MVARSWAGSELMRLMKVVIVENFAITTSNLRRLRLIRTASLPRAKKIEVVSS
jgi:hypothetical protein